MRSSALFTAALTAGVLARPPPHFEKGYRNMVTRTEVVVTTVTVYVTEGYVEPASTSFLVPASTSKVAESSGAVSAHSLPPSENLVSESAPTPTLAPSSAPTPELHSSNISELVVEQKTFTSILAPKSSSVEILQAPSSTIQAPIPTAASNGHLSGADQAYLSSGPDYQAAVLYHHNAARANHDAAPLVWDTACEANARVAAQKCTFQHFLPDGAGQGQNLFTVSGDAFNVTAGITESWYKGELNPMKPYFGQKDIPEDVFHSVGHLTQLVWKGTTKVGCVSIDCGANMIVGGSTSSMNKYTVCNYAPAGNVGGGYADNVAAPISTTNLGGWAD